VAYIGREVNIGNKWRMNAHRTQSLRDFAQVFSFFHGGRGDANNFTPGFVESAALLDGGGGIHRVGCGHGFNANGIFATQFDDAKANFNSFTAAISVWILDVGHRSIVFVRQC